MWTVIRQFAALFVIHGRLKIKVKFGQLFCEYCYSQFTPTINSFIWMFIRRYQTVMEGIVFVYIFKSILFVGHLNEYSQFACLQQLIRCFLFANVKESVCSQHEILYLIPFHFLLNPASHTLGIFPYQVRFFNRF